ncbi:DUF4430 domain-containing protein [Paenibacillus sp. BR2-3]|uniref:DUF4430 domain-containing protein n=1 Tax=Paenibacillus sp. BR2-3 TaxID=3048494 RepID=UPI0039777D0B
MSKQAARWLSLLSALLIVVFLAGGCSSGKEPASGQNSALSSPGSVQQPTAQASGDAVSPSPEGNGIEDNPSSAGKLADAAEASSTAAPNPDPGSAQPSASASSEAGGTSDGASSDGGSAKTPVPTQPSSAVTAKPSPAAKPASPSAAPAAGSSEKTNLVTISINGDNEYGLILAPAAVEVQSGDNVMDILKRVTRQHKIQMEFQGTGPVAYVEGIDNLYEFDKGAESGWMYRVNGEFQAKGAGAYTVTPGDHIEWLYTLDLGKDIGAKRP